MLIFIVPCNDEYAILKNFAILEKTPNVPALDLPGLDIVGTAKAFGCTGIAANTADEIKSIHGCADCRGSQRNRYPYCPADATASARRHLEQALM